MIKSATLTSRTEPVRDRPDDRRDDLGDFERELAAETTRSDPASDADPATRARTHKKRTNAADPTPLVAPYPLPDLVVPAPEVPTAQAPRSTVPDVALTQVAPRAPEVDPVLAQLVAMMEAASGEVAIDPKAIAAPFENAIDDALDSDVEHLERAIDVDRAAFTSHPASQRMAPPAPPAPVHSLAEQVADVVARLHAESGERSDVVRFRGSDFGFSAVLRQDAGGTSVRLVSDDPATRALLGDRLPEVRQALERVGFAATGLSVATDARDHQRQHQPNEPPDEPPEIAPLHATPASEPDDDVLLVV